MDIIISYRTLAINIVFRKSTSIYHILLDLYTKINLFLSYKKSKIVSH